MTVTQKHRPTRLSLVSLATAYADQAGDETELVIPAEAEALQALSTEEITALSARAQEAFDALYDPEAEFSDEDIATLESLTDGIERLATETASRETAAAERAERAAEFAARVRGDEGEGDGGEEPAEGDEPEAPAEGDEPAEGAEAPAENEPEAVVAAAAPTPTPRETRVSMSAVRARQSNRATPAPRSANVPFGSIQDVLVASATTTVAEAGTGVDWAQAGQILDRTLQGYNHTQYQSAADRGRHMNDQRSLLVINRPFTPDQVITDPGNFDHVEQVLRNVTDETRLSSSQGSGSLVAAGGWCAPSETLYDLIDMGESRDGLLSLPEVGVSRGGIQFTKGPDFASIYADIAEGEWSITEQDDIEGKYAKGSGAEAGQNVEGPKPYYKVECTPFEEHRLDVDGLQIRAGLLQSKGYPEILARTLKGALIAHDHKMNGKLLAQMAAGSTAIAMPTTQVGALAPLLNAIALQVEHYRSIRRLSRSATLEGIFPYWVRDVIRHDLSRREGVDLTSVPDSRVDGWFRERGVSPQYVYNWQSIGGTAASFTAWPTTVEFLLYSAGTWIRGASDIITLDTMYDSTLLGNNDFTALFTEEGWFVAKRGHDSRKVSVTLSLPGAQAAAVAIAHDGTKAV